ncbi:class I SAM-dependent methyltransferase [Desulfotignum phosphitoxidans]|uniref:Methyltransferase domain-containing protein n=1 Tax=Desulfotignum phosphitoxidans DSM 13687 TaxID=1286635 RepID=S0FYZ8_9BACT|nr:class I SAM-dependent methyltransferase [Desulfotignum phosphitoxidans]EMS77172.1 methyltransferase domain-containing protein [Desulfotignum phosphitoxidans DSM 13687]
MADTSSSNLFKNWDYVYQNWDVFELPWVEKDIHPVLAQKIREFASAEGYALDIGCGLGQVSRHLASAGYKVYGIDASDRAINLAKGMTPEGLEIAYMVADSVRFVPEVKFDLVVDFLHLHDIQAKDLSVYIDTLLKISAVGATMITTSLSEKDPTATSTGERDSHFADCKVYYRSSKQITDLFFPYAKLISTEIINVGRGAESYLANLLVFRKTKILGQPPSGCLDTAPVVLP